MSTSFKIISYDLGGPETSDSYKKLIETIKTFPEYAKPLESFWIVKTNLDCKTVRDKLLPYLDDNDRIFVATLPIGTGDSWASYGLPAGIADWLNGR